MFGGLLAVAGAFGFDYYHNTKMDASSKKYSDRLSALNSRVNDQYKNIEDNIDLVAQEARLNNEHYSALAAEREKTEAAEREIYASDRKIKAMQDVIDSQAEALKKLSEPKPATMAESAKANTEVAKNAKDLEKKIDKQVKDLNDKVDTTVKAKEATKPEAKAVPVASVATPATKPLNKKQRREAAKAKAAAKAAGK